MKTQATLRTTSQLCFAASELSLHGVRECMGLRTPAGRVIDSAQAFAEALLEESLVALVPGEDFGDCARTNIRVSFACSEQQITEGLGRLRAFVEALR